jgi:tryptophan-rich sensory protein
MVSSYNDVMKCGNTCHAVIAIVICEVVGVLGAIVTVGSIITWYDFLNKPSFSPPNWVFAVVWLILYALMGLAAYFVWKEHTKKLAKYIRKSLNLFGLQLALNFLWSFLFFGMRSALYGLIDIVFLWLVIIVTTIDFYRVSKRAAALMIPYILWVTFAMVLNIFILLLNR